MPRFTRTVEVAAPVDRVWAALVDWPRHGAWVPLTTVRTLTPSPAGVGARFVGRTALGPLGFDDVMKVVVWQPPDGARPGFCEVAKVGRLLQGMASFEVVASEQTDGGARSRVSWTEDVRVAPEWLTRPFGSLIALISGLGLRRVLAAMAADVERDQHG
ncbi:MAG: SRPBCC family protein [Kineosporiaceae bacterium]|jgi:carbon monoxide dehydrogenase subunit G